LAGRGGEKKKNRFFTQGDHEKEEEKRRASQTPSLRAPRKENRTAFSERGEKGGGEYDLPSEQAPEGGKSKYSQALKGERRMAHRYLSSAVAKEKKKVSVLSG